MKRKRGVVLTDSGRARFDGACMRLVESRTVLRINGSRLSAYSKKPKKVFVSATTINQVLKNEPVQQDSLKLLFNLVELTLEKSDYQYPTTDDPESPEPDWMLTPQLPNNIPFTGTLSFVGREILLNDLHTLLSEPVSQVQPVALSGMGGVGKTELAIQYARRYSSAYSARVCWISARRLDAENNASIPVQIVTFAQIYLGIDIPASFVSTHDRLAYCWQHWPQGEALIIYDDVENYSDISPHYLPRDTRFKVVLTTRINLQDPVRNFSVEVLERADSIDLLALIVKDDRVDDETATDELCAFLGDLPLAVELSGHYLAVDTSLSIASFCQELRDRQAIRKVPSSLAFEGDAQENADWTITARRGLEAAFDLSWERLSQSIQLTAKLIGRLEPGPIGWNMVEIMRAFLAQEYPEDGPYSPDEMTRAKNTLIRFNLLKPFDASSYRLHPLTREFFRSKTTDEEYERYSGDNEEDPA